MTRGFDTGAMSMEEQQRDSRPFGITWLVVSFFAGSVAWSAFHLVGYLWATVACSVPERLLIGVTAAVASAITLGAMWHEIRAWRGIREHDVESAAQRAATSTDRFIAVGGLFLNAFFLASIVLTTLSVFFLGVCE